ETDDESDGAAPDPAVPDDAPADTPDDAPSGMPEDAPGAAPEPEQDERPTEAPSLRPPSGGAPPEETPDAGASSLVPVGDLPVGSGLPGTAVAGGTYGPDGQIRVVDCTRAGALELVGRDRVGSGTSGPSALADEGSTVCRRLATGDLDATATARAEVLPLVP